MVENHDAELLARGIQPVTWSSFPANRISAHNMPLSTLIGLSYDIPGKYILGSPNWLDSQLYDVDAKVEGDKKLSYEETKPLLQDMLRERFHFAAHHESRLVSGFALTIAKGGPKLTPGKGIRKPYGQVLPDGLQTWRFDTKSLCGLLAIPAGQPIVDKTGLSDTYDVKLSYAPASDPNTNLPDFFTALQEQLGLKLVPQKVPVDYLVIDYVDRIPTEN